MPDLSAATLELPPNFSVNTLNMEIYPQNLYNPIELKIGLIGCFKPMYKTTTGPNVSTTPYSQSKYWVCPKTFYMHIYDYLIQFHIYIKPVLSSKATDKLNIFILESC